MPKYEDEEEYLDDSPSDVVIDSDDDESDNADEAGFVKGYNEADDELFEDSEEEF